MRSVESSPERVQALLDATEAGVPIVMINLLRFRDQAEYPEGSDAAPCSGREAYGRYGEGVMPLLGKAGGRPIWTGSVQVSVIAVEGEEWHQAVLVEYPSREAFTQMITSAEYLAVAFHRTAALEDSRLIAATTGMNQLGSLGEVHER